MVEIKGLTHRFGSQLLFEDVNLKLNSHNRYGLIGANGAGKSTFLKILSSQVEHTSGDIIIESGKKIGVLGQDQFAFENFTLKDAVLWGNKRLYDAIKEKEKLYLSEEFTDEINERLSELEIITAEEDPTYEYETRIEKILSSLGLHEYDKLMSEIESSDKVKILLAQVSDKQGQAGEIIASNGLCIACGTQSLTVLQIQRQGKKAMHTQELLRGFEFKIGTIL